MSSERPADLIWSVSDFVDIFNQTLEFAYPSVIIVGELANFKISKNRWVYFDLKDEFATVKFFGTVYQLPGPLEEGMLLQVRGSPRLHKQFGFSVNVLSMQPVGEGSIKKAAQLLEAKLRSEGLFEEARKRPMPYPPATIGLIASSESAAYHDFIKVLNGRWRGIEINLADVQVQGEAAPSQIIEAIEYFGQHSSPPEILVITRGGGSPEDLSAFSTEQVTRAVAASRIPTLVAIGHEIDISLAELAADKRASTPSNAAEMLVPDIKHEQLRLEQTKTNMAQIIERVVVLQKENLQAFAKELEKSLADIFTQSREKLAVQSDMLTAFYPKAILRRGYAIMRSKGQLVRSGKQLYIGDKIQVELIDAEISATTKSIKLE